MKKITKVIVYLLLPFYIIYQIVKTLENIAKIRITRNIIVKLIDSKKNFLYLGSILCDMNDYDKLFIFLSERTHRTLSLLNLLNSAGLIDMKTVKPMVTELEATMNIADKNSKFIHKLNELYNLTGNKTILVGLTDKSTIIMGNFGNSIFENRLRKAVLKYKGILEKMN